ncbi:MAG: glycosyl hydrolase family 98 [Prevotella sp.]|nr:glycosyl hydrolase family 98 [Prevotella sp.]
MKKALVLLLLALTATMQGLKAQERRPIDSQHPLWFIHCDVWYKADPQKIIDLIPEDVRPYICLNLSLSCQYDKEKNQYKMPHYAFQTYKSWGTVCQQNGIWFSCQPASGGHTHIQDDDLVTFEYFFKQFPNFLGWNYAEQFWGFDEGGDLSSSKQVTRWALFAKLVEMSHKYGGFLTVSFCGNIWSHPLNPIGEMKRTPALLEACRKYPEAILWLYKYTTSSCFYNNESVTFGPFISGLAKNYGVRYDNCGWNGAMDDLLGKDHGKKYPAAAGIGTVMEQTCVNGGAVWDGPELTWNQECFHELWASTVDNGYTRRRWERFPNFNGVWLDMFRQVINGTMYIPTREEVVGKTKVVVINDVNNGSDEDKYATWGDLYDGLYKQTDPFNRRYGQWMDNYCYFKSTGRYGAIPMVTGLYDDAAKAIPVQVKKSQRTSNWDTQAKKVSDFNAQYPEVSSGDLYVNRYRNQLVTYTPYTYLNTKTTAQATIPLQYNTCETLELNYDKLSSGIVREYEDHIDFYLNNYRSDSTGLRTDIITIKGATTKPTYTLNCHPIGSEFGSNADVHALANHITGQTPERFNVNAADVNNDSRVDITDVTAIIDIFKKAQKNASATDSYDNGTYTLTVRHNSAVTVTINCAGAASHPSVDYAATVLQPTPLPLPKAPALYRGPIIIEAEDMDYKNIQSCCTDPFAWYPSVTGHAGNGFVDMGTNPSGSLRHYLRLKEGQTGDYHIQVRYTGTSADGSLSVNVNGSQQTVSCPRTAQNEWHLATVNATLNTGQNTLVITNSGGKSLYIDQVVYQPADAEPLKYGISVRSAENGSVTANRNEAAEGETVKLTVSAAEGYRLKELRLVNSVFFTLGKTIPVNGEGEVTFNMIADNVVLQPVFTSSTPLVSDALGNYRLDFKNTLSGNLPEGWRCVQEDNTEHQYPNSYGQGARTFDGFTGYQGKALYWRNDRAEYGRQEQYPLTLSEGNYELTFAMAAWKGEPKYKVSILDADTGNSVAVSDVFTAAPNANGSTSANMSSAVSHALTFNINKAGKYVISFTDASGGYDEFLLLECRLKTISADSDLTAANYHVWDGCTAWPTVTNTQGNGAYDLNKELQAGNLVYGDGNVYYTHYANLTGYDRMVIHGTPGVQLRVLLNRLEVGNGGGDQNGGALTELTTTIGDDGKAEVDLTSYEFVHLNAIKLRWGSPSGEITRLQLLKGE